jgi:hypothetical protein
MRADIAGADVRFSPPLRLPLAKTAASTGLD